MAQDPTAYHVMNGPSQFHVIGSIRDWEAESRLHRILVSALVISGRQDEATPKLQAALVRGIGESHQVIPESSSYAFRSIRPPIPGETGRAFWLKSATYSG